MNKEIINSLLDKSEEAFLMAIEIYNKPTIKYRLEGFVFFICNAWELLLKAKMLSDGDSIYYPDKPTRTISLSNCISHVLTNDKDPVRKNIEIINSIRNISTHFVIKEMDSVYLPFMQSNVLNYSQKLYDYFGRDITNKINSSFMTLFVDSEPISDEQILNRYGDNVFEKFTKIRSDVTNMLSDSNNDKLAIKIDLNMKLVKDIDKAKTTFRFAKDGEEPARIIKELKDPNLTHSLSQKRVRELVEESLRKKEINIKLNQYNLKLITNKFDLKNNEKYFYKFELSNTWGCSMQLVEFLTDLFLNNPDIIDEIKKELKENKE